MKFPAMVVVVLAANVTAPVELTVKFWNVLPAGVRVPVPFNKRVLPAVALYVLLEKSVPPRNSRYLCRN